MTGHIFLIIVLTITSHSGGVQTCVFTQLTDRAHVKAAAVQLAREAVSTGRHVDDVWVNVECSSWGGEP